MLSIRLDFYFIPKKQSLCKTNNDNNNVCLFKISGNMVNALVNV